MASFQNGLKLWCESLFIHIPLCPVCFVWTLISYVHYIKTVRVLWLLCELGKQRNSRSLWAIDFHSDSSSCLWMQCEILGAYGRYIFIVILLRAHECNVRKVSAGGLKLWFAFMSCCKPVTNWVWFPWFSRWLLRNIWQGNWWKKY